MIEHDNIVDYFDLIETANNIYLFMQYCPNGTLETLLK
jgi:serine/threonine protein kinase